MNASQDIFISYKSENAGLARTVAEALKALGLKVWFAEYEVLLHNYDDFQIAIDRGIDASRYALLFTTNTWAESRWCQVEIARILQRIPLERILRVSLPAEDHERVAEDESRTSSEEVRDRSTILKQWNLEHVLRGRIVAREDLLPHRQNWMVEKPPADSAPDMFDVRVAPQEWPPQSDAALSDVKTLHCPSSATSDETVAEVLSFVALHTGLLRKSPTFPPVSAPARSAWWPVRLGRGESKSQSVDVATGRRDFALFGLGFSLDFGSWQLTSAGCTASEGGNFNGPTFCRELDGGRCEGRLVIGEGYPSLEATSQALASTDDRERYGHLRKFAQSFERACREGLQIEIKYCGLHIVRLDSAQQGPPITHAAFTCRLGGQVMPHWQRRYSIAVVHPLTQALFEFAFTFDWLGSFDTFLRHAFSMERIVTSLQIGIP